MKVALSPVSGSRLVACTLSGLLSFSVLVTPVAAQSPGEAKAAPAGIASSKSHKAKNSAKAAKSAVKPAAETRGEAAKPPRKTARNATKPVRPASGRASKPASEPDDPAMKPTKQSGKKNGKHSLSKPDKAAIKQTLAQADETAVKPTGKAARKAGKRAGRAGKAARRAKTARIKLAFQASVELRPMAQQLANLRTPAAYAGVTSYAHQHTGEAAAAAYLALGHAYLLDKRYADAEASLRQARRAGQELADYADFLAARANHAEGSDAAAEALLRGFTQRYPDSIFDAEAPELEANTLIAMGDAAGAARVLAAAADTDSANRPGFELAQAQVASTQGQTQEVLRLYRHLLLSHPLSPEAEVARTKLVAMGAESSLTTAELRSLGDAYWNGGHYADASEQYRALARQSSLDPESRNGFDVAALACDLKLKRLTTAQVDALPDTQDENGARRLYLLMELARNRNDLDEQQNIVLRMESSFPASNWLAEALYSSGNMYLLRHEYSTAAAYYSYLATHFPAHKYAATAHWRAGWLSYRQGQYTDAARLFDEQISLYPAAQETSAALYWRGRLNETQEHRPAAAAANYRALIRAYQHYFYAQLARERLAALGDAQPLDAPQVDAPQLARFQPQPVPELQESFPIDSPHLAKARLLANAGLNDYIAQEINADPDSASWSALAEAQIYASYGENFRALRALKRALPFAAAAPISSIPLAYWRILFPEPYWSTIQAESAKNNLDPYLVASLIRQESEFNPAAVSGKNACGLMQLLPSVGRSMAREEGISHFDAFQLFDPITNIRLGTRYLRQTLDKFGGVPEYALAAYDAGDDRVVDWKAAGPYQGIDEFVESIPFTETREYVEAILRNQETYRAIDAYAASQGKATAGAGR
jgi:soluble lytic murein transglycosylase